MRFGAELTDAGGVRFRLFAPAVTGVDVVLGGGREGVFSMEPDGSGWYELLTEAAGAGTWYKFRLPDGSEVPDPASRFQPEDVHGPSEVVDGAAHVWNDGGWRGRPWSAAVLYELHIGTFTPDGTFNSAIARLDHLAELGVTAIELMCVADFAGLYNWGYDGVLLYAPDSAYGRPEEMKEFVEAAHARGIMVILDVVYNHFGPEGNYISKYFPQMCSDRHCTPWGQAFNFDGEGSEQVRELIVQNALYWIEEFHLDGLRLDAAHAMIDTSPKHILEELAERVKALAGDRIVHLILENEDNIASRLVRDGEGRVTDFTAQWNHDITHLLGASMAKRCSERDGDEGGETERLGRALAEGFVIAAQEKGKATPESRVPPTAFVAFTQTHDLVGNRIAGERVSSVASEQAAQAIASVCLLLPQIPMLFMGEEWGASTPFPYFCDYHGDLAEAVRKGRCEQLSNQEPKPDPKELERAPDPQSEATFRSAKLRWEEIEQEPHAGWLELYTRLLRVRRDLVAPLLPKLTETCGTYKVVAPGAVTVEWTFPGGARLSLEANLCDTPTAGFHAAADEVIFEQGSGAANGGLGPWSVRWRLKRAAV